MKLTEEQEYIVEKIDYIIEWVTEHPVEESIPEEDRATMSEEMLQVATGLLEEYAAGYVAALIDVRDYLMDEIGEFDNPSAPSSMDTIN